MARRLRKTRAAVVMIAGLAGGAVGIGGAEAASFGYVNTGSPMSANTVYYSSQKNHTGNYISSCQNPTFSAAIYLTTTGGTQIRRVDGNCALFNTGHSQENSTRARCWNKASSSKYARCTQVYN